MGLVTSCRRTRAVTSIGIAFAVLVGMIAVESPRVGASSKYKWAPIERAHVVTPFRGANPKSLPFGAVVSAATIARSRRLYSWVSSFNGSVGYALTYIDGFQYPLRTTDNGSTWTIDSPYWSGPWADAGAGAVYIDAFSRSTAVAYGNQGSTSRPTADAGGISLTSWGRSKLLNPRT